MSPFLTMTLGALLTLAVVPVAPAQTKAPADSGAKPGAVAYPDNPSGTPQAENKGAPVVTDKAACSSGTKCPDRPAPSTAADSGTTGGTPPPTGGVSTPSTAYPDSPVKTPAAEVTNGTAPKR